MNSENKNNDDINNIISEFDNINKLLFFLSAQNNRKEKIENNIIYQIKKSPNILEKKSSLILFIQELIKQLESGNNIIIPFLEICPILIKSYIDNDLDEEEELKYIELFKLLKINSFISREYLFPIYEYFSDIFYVMNDIKENDKKLKKFNKVFELWKIFYDFNIDKRELKDFNSSSYCFIGGGLEIKLLDTLKLEDFSFRIEIDMFENNYFDLNKELILFEYKNKDCHIKIKYNQMQDFMNPKTFNKISFILSNNKITIIIEKENDKNKLVKTFDLKMDYIKNFI